jgi:hypothetical protein
MATYSDPPFSRSNLHHMRHCIAEGSPLEVPSIVVFLEILYTAHATVAHGQSTQ